MRSLSSLFTLVSMLLPLAVMPVNAASYSEQCNRHGLLIHSTKGHMLSIGKSGDYILTTRTGISQYGVWERISSKSLRLFPNNDWKPWLMPVPYGLCYHTN